MYPFTRKPDFSVIRKVLIVRQDRLGDLILSLPLASLIKQYYPQVQVDFLVPEYTRVVAEAYADTDTVRVLPKDLNDTKAFSSCLQEIRSAAYDLVLVPNTKSKIADLVYQADIPYRVGQGLRLHGWKYNLPVFQRRKRPDRNELDYNFGLLQRWFRMPSPDSVKFPFVLPAAAEQKVSEFLKAAQIQTYCIIHPGSGGSAIDVSQELLAELIQQYDFPGKILITGSPSEKPLAEKLALQGGDKTLDVSGQLSLTELMVLIRGCALFIGNSTGPLHIARAFERPLLGFYSAYPACHPKRWGPYGQEESATILPPGESYAAFEPDKEKSRQHMSRLDVQAVMDHLDRTLGRRP